MRARKLLCLDCFNINDLMEMLAEVEVEVRLESATINTMYVSGCGTSTCLYEGIRLYRILFGCDCFRLRRGRPPKATKCHLQVSYHHSLCPRGSPLGSFSWLPFLERVLCPWMIFGDALAMSCNWEALRREGPTGTKPACSRSAFITLLKTETIWRTSRPSLAAYRYCAVRPLKKRWVARSSNTYQRQVLYIGHGLSLQCFYRMSPCSSMASSIPGTLPRVRQSPLQKNIGTNRMECFLPHELVLIGYGTKIDSMLHV